jgi:hypothetical protein
VDDAAVIRSLLQTADVLEATTRARLRLAADAQHDWTGRTRATFDDELARHVRRALDLADACRRAASAVAAAESESRFTLHRAHAPV